jgi:CRISPR system Cascade subunit CasC
MLIELHMIQNYAPSNLNRDDTGAPKDAIFGDAVRARISSQAIKRSIRRSEIFRDAFENSELLANRTRLLPSLLRQELQRRDDLDQEAIDAIVNKSQELGRESDRAIAKDDGEGDPKTAQLIFLSTDEVVRLAKELGNLYLDRGPKGFEKLDSKELNRGVGSTRPRSVDVAMFGRMTTSAAFEDVQAAVQVAHAISTHKIEQEFDYYTAVDDISGESGAGFIGDTAFNSATYYKYLSIHWEGLVKNLGGEDWVAKEAVKALVAAAATVNPTGKQNSFAAHNLPDLVLIEARSRNIPISYANAFVEPARAWGGTSLVDASTTKLSDYIDDITTMYEIPAERAFTSTDRELAISNASRCPSLTALIEWIPFPNGASA